MAEPNHGLNHSIQPPPPPPLPPGRTGGVFQKFIAPLSFNIGARPHGPQATQSAGVSHSTAMNRAYRNLPSQTVAHRTGIPILAIDINKVKTHAILAGQDILKTVHVQDGRMVEDFNLRSGIRSYAHAYAARAETTNNRREYLPTKDVVWSKGDRFDTIIAAAALNGRIALYDVSRLNSSRIELSWIHEHSNQVNKLDFDPTGGYLLLSGSQDRTVKVWDIREPQSVKRKQNINIRQPVRDVRWSPTDVGEFALCTENGVVQRWDLRMTSSALLSINAHEKACYAIDWHPDGRHLVSGGFDKYAKVWDFKSDNRRQKPLFSLRAPQAILQIRWRPPCWSSNLAEKGHWQSAQLATSYTEDDSRIHIWDLRRPLLPFRELDRYHTKPLDMLWASKDYLWSVGHEGVFAQTDIRYASLVHGELCTSATQFMPDGSFISFSEDTQTRHDSTSDDAAAGFLRIPQEKLSGGTDGVVSRSMSDDDDDDGFLTTSTKRRMSKSSRTAKSQGNTPPTGEAFPHIISLDRAVLNKNGLFNNEQSGVVSSITGLSAEPEVVAFLAENYACPMSLEERRHNPEGILSGLEKSFARNARACDYVSMHRTAQTWRMLSSIIVPELRDWADWNRKERLQMEIKRRESAKSTSLNQSSTSLPPHSLLNRAKVMSNLFKGVTESERKPSEVESSSNMTTPTARPLSDSPYFQQHHNGGALPHLNESIENIPQLPPSVVSAHSTAAAASKALLDTEKEISPPSSPERSRRPTTFSMQHRRAVTDVPLHVLDRAAHLQSPKPQLLNKQSSSPIVQPSPRMELRKQEDRRAAIRDFRGQQRQLFTLEDPIHSPRYSINDRHNSSESFTMFSASTDSSQRARSLGQSFDIIKDRQQGHRDSIGDVVGTPQSDASDVSNQQNRDSHLQDFDDDNMQEDFPMDETSRVDFGLESTREEKKTVSRPKTSASASMWDIGELNPSENPSRSDTAASTASDEALLLEETSNTKKLRIYTSNPIRRIASRSQSVVPDTTGAQHELEEDSGSKDYILRDFRPIDFTTYEPRLPFAWSALPLLCHSVAFDTSEGPASSQFSVHLLMHLYPYFFDLGLYVKIHAGVGYPDSISDKLMRPDFSHRVIEGLFLNHYFYLKRNGLFKPMTELRNVCTDFGLDGIFQPDEADQAVGASLKQDKSQIQASCSHCCSFIQPENIVCANCGQLRPVCPICLQIARASDAGDIQRSHHGLNLWTFCQACGHGAHWSCMQEWMLQPETEGECPTLGCGCDCSPGATRRQRIARQLSDAETTEIIRGGRSSATMKKDPVRASHSPAVDKTRDALRNSEITRDSSGDERVRSSFSGRRGSRGGIGMGGGNTLRGASQSMGRRVRLVTPGESEPA